MDETRVPIFDKDGKEIGYMFYSVEIFYGEELKRLEMTITDRELAKNILNDKRKERKIGYHVVEPSKKDVAEEIIDYLNEKAGKRFRPVASNLKFINARLKEGYTIDDLKYVIDIKVADNKAGKFENLYLRPETLFNATKFQGYINQKTNIKKPKDRW